MPLEVSGPVPRRERGAALLTVLLLVAVIAVLAGHALERMRLATRLGGNAIAMEQRAPLRWPQKQRRWCASTACLRAMRRG